MRALTFVAALLSMSPVAHAACDAGKVLTDLRAGYPAPYVPNPKAYVTLRDTFRAKELKRVAIAGEEYPLENTGSGPAELFVVTGSSRVSGTSLWAVLVDAGSCAIVGARELAHSGGGGLVPALD